MHITLGQLKELIKNFDDDLRIVISGDEGSGYDDISGIEIIEIGLSTLSGLYQGEHEKTEFLDENQKNNSKIVKALHLR